MHSRQQQGNQRNKLDGGMGISKDQNDAVLVTGDAFVCCHVPHIS